MTDARPANGTYLLEARQLRKEFGKHGRRYGRRESVVAVDDVSFAINQGEVFGLVGESGSGKTTLGRIVMRLIPATSGEVRFEGRDILSIRRDELCRAIQIVFQDPYGSLNPAIRVNAIIGEALRQTSISRRDWPSEVERLLESVGLSRSVAEKFPRQLSGGQRQRVGIARALAVRPRLIVADEPVSALDVSIQAQILNLLVDLKEEFGLTYLFISHDFNVMRYICDRISVMYRGSFVEEGPADDLLSSPQHPYTMALLDAVPNVNGGARRTSTTTSFDREDAGVEDVEIGCRYLSRCPIARQQCAQVGPVLTHSSLGRGVACHFPLDPQGLSREVEEIPMRRR